ncbi:AAA domain-containing protein [Saccharopolyspora sp. NPDC050642]|uniref:AAA domain-containing protein n=1 Tax=Saccharopolyspora sp. NPDC050642 TaxID=3157099 RepID=UPI0033C24DBF
MGWLDEVIEAVASQLPDRAKPARPTTKLVGRAVQTEPGRYRVSTRNNATRIDELSDLRLMPEDRDEPSYRVIDAYEEQEAVVVQVGRHAPQHGLVLRGTGRPADFLVRSQLEALKKLSDPGFADRLATGRIDALPRNVADVGALQGAQAQAHHACVSPGLHLVWGPPGTGKTTVLGRAIDDLVGRGSRVLLVSGTNIAVDNALFAALKLGSPARGELLRVGTPQMRQIAMDDRVALRRIIAARIHELEERRHSVEEELLRLQQSPTLQRLKILDDRLIDYDFDAHQAALERIERTTGIEQLQRVREQRATEAADARSRLETSRRALSTAREQHRAASKAAQQLREAEQLTDVLRGLAAEVERRQRELDRIAAERQQLAARSQRSADRPGLRGWIAQRYLRQQLSDTAGLARHASAQVRQARNEFDRQSSALKPRIAQHRTAADPFDQESIDRISGQLEAAEHAVRASEDAVAAADQRLQEAGKALSAAEALRRATPDDHRLAAHAARHDLANLHAEREEARAGAEAEIRRRASLEKEHEELLARLAKEQNEAEPEIIRNARLVATTLSRAHLNKAVAEGPYDVVLVDEAAAAAIPDVLLAVSLASRTVTLLGDFCQLGPIEPANNAKRQQVTRWLTRDCFELAGITTADQALREPGCAALLETHRFGPNLVELANRIAYGGHLRVAPNRSTHGDDTEIILITTDNLGEMGQFRHSPTVKGRWWPAGSVLSHALAEHHLGKGETVGVVTPYKLQRKATQAYLQDLGQVAEQVEVGTTHSFQGREFDVVILDTVEDGSTRGWIAQGSMSSTRSFQRAGARLLNVGATRAKHRLYVLCAWKTVRDADPGTVLHAAREMVNNGVKGIRADDFLGLTAAERRPAADPIEEDVWEAFDDHVHVVADGMFDERGYYPAVLDDIGGARESIWMWSPWVHPRMDTVLPQLRAARERGLEVFVFASDHRDNHDRTDPAAARRIAELDATATYLVRVKAMHQKIVVLDEETVYLGSLNSLSSSPEKPRREIMVRHRGHRFAKHILEHERAKDFIPPEKCSTCSVQMELTRSNSERSGYEWVWVCPRHPRKHRHPVRPGK